MKKESILREIFSGTSGRLSSKRIIGSISLGVALGCAIYLTIKDGSTDVVENIIITILIISASLLGLPAIAGAWGKGKISVGNSVPPIDASTGSDDTVKEAQESMPDCDNCYYKELVTSQRKKQDDDTLI